MTAMFAAEVTLGAAQARLAEIGQWLPIDGDPQSSLGDLVASNSTGPLRLGYGAWRDLLLGVQFANGRGELISAGGQTMKNVAGYDLTKFIVGSAGIFGKIETLTTRTYVKPAGAILVRHKPEARILNRLMPTSLRPQWAMLAPDALLCGYLGDSQTIDFFRAKLPQSEPVSMVERTVDEDIAERAALLQMKGAIACRAAVPPARIAEFAAALHHGSWIADAAFGAVLGSDIPESDMAPLRDSAASVGGSVRFFRRGGPGASWAIDFSTNPTERQIIERLKMAFDPDGKLTPLPWQIS